MGDGSWSVASLFKSASLVVSNGFCDMFKVVTDLGAQLGKS